MFMMILRNSLNDLGLSGFVKKSDQLLAVRTNFEPAARSLQSEMRTT